MKARGILALGMVALLAAAASATPISYISTAAPVTFSPEGGASGLGVLTVYDEALPIVIHYNDGTQGVLDDCEFLITADLTSDESANGIASGNFLSGSYTLKDVNQNDLLSGSLVELTLTETWDNRGILSATGIVTTETGSLLGDFGSPRGSLYEIIFQVQPSTIEDLGVPFGGNGNISMSPMIPEPATLTLLSMAMLGIVLRRRR